MIEKEDIDRQQKSDFLNDVKSLKSLKKTEFWMLSEIFLWAATLLSSISLLIFLYALIVAPSAPPAIAYIWHCGDLMIVIYAITAALQKDKRKLKQRKKWTKEEIENLKSMIRVELRKNLY